ncbi:hypothetical protein [Paludisphaera soli]|uniref:hypothetical protein n=1 Tax=Paludisphaera soli TaxID=2712865 RepID=UPI0013ED1864|nr:hypothetical protein [Paludisphaera soli]
MIKGIVNYGIAISAALAVLLTLIAPVGLRTGASIPAASSRVLTHRYRSNCKMERWNLDKCQQRRLSFELCPTNQLDFKEVMDVDEEEESTSAFLPVPPSFDLLPSPRPDAIGKVNRSSISGATRPLRC